MKKTSKALLLMLCAVLLVAASVLGTMAYLTSSDEVVNTFTVGKVAITLDEAKVGTDGTPVTGADRVKDNEYHLIPGHLYTKDPTIHVDSKSEDCWLFVKVENGIAAIEADTKIADQMATNGWTPVAAGSNVYARSATNKAGDDVVVFGSFKIGNVDNTTLANYVTIKDSQGNVSGTLIKVTAYAIQAEGFATAAAAWTASGFGA